jgi:hypothetical protein
MPNFCPHCGTAVTENSATNCLSCEKPLSGSSETTKNDSFNDSKEKLFNFAKNVKDLSIKASADLRSEETKAKIKDFANQAQSFATEKTNDLKEELGKINEARKATANEAKDFESNSKLETSKVVALSFWSKLTTKQKTIFIGLPLFLFVIFMSIIENKNKENWSIPYAANFINTCATTIPVAGGYPITFCTCAMLGVKKKYSMAEHDALIGTSKYQPMLKSVFDNCKSNVKYYKDEPFPH